MSSAEEFEPETSPVGIQMRHVLRMFSLLIITLVGFVITLGVFLFFFQGNMIYFPRQYAAHHVKDVETMGRFIEYETDAGSQAAIFVPQREENPDELQLWVMYHGNASWGVDWLDLAHTLQRQKPSLAFLMIDYPGYGKNEGKPHPDTILDSSLVAFSTLAEELDLSVEELAERTGILGFSLGAAAGCQLAAKIPVRRMILLSPFTSMEDMARIVVGRLGPLVLRHRFDNVARLNEIARQENPPDIVIFHGETDDIVPFQMGEKLASLHPEMIELRVINSDHNWILSVIMDDLIELMTGSFDEGIE